MEKVKCIENVIGKTEGIVYFIKGKSYISTIPENDESRTLWDEQESSHIVGVDFFEYHFEEI